MSITASLIAPLAAQHCLGGFDIPMIVYNESNSSTYKVGAPLIDSTGVLTESTSALSSSNRTCGVAVQAGQNIASAPAYPAYGIVYPSGAGAPNAFGVSQASATTGAALVVAPLLLVPALPHVVFAGTLANGGADAAVATTDVFTRYGITKDSSSGFWYVDKGGSNGCYTLAVSEPSPATVTFGTTKGVRMLFVFRAQVTQYS